MTTRYDRGGWLRTCELCDNTGWTEAPDLITDDERTYSQVQPCRCTIGLTRRDTHTHILTKNDEAPR